MHPLVERRTAPGPLPTPALVVWSAPAFRAESKDELARAAPGAAVLRDPVGHRLGLADAYAVCGGSLPDVARTLRAEAVFTRHVQPVDSIAPMRGLDDAIERLGRARDEIGPARVDLTGLSRAHVRRILRESAPVTPRSDGAGEVLCLSALCAGGWLYIGTSRVADLLGTWPGGDPHFPPEPVSRAGAKLRQALLLLNPPLKDGAQVLDLGAAPGGFASVLLERGARVLAVDPAPLHPLLPGAPALTCIRTYAANVVPEDVPLLDLLTCDVVTTPASAAALVCRFAPRLKPGAPAIVTLKLRAKGAGSAGLAGVAALFEPLLDLERLRHLFANRCEVTAFLRRRDTP